MVKEVKKCPAFSCEETAVGTCVNAAGALTAGRKIKVKACEATKFCSYNAASFIVDEACTAQCTEPGAKAKDYVLPGETCETTDDCKKVYTYDTTGAEVETKTCDAATKKCVGAADTKKCKDDESCVAGLYCDETDAANKVCKPQKANGVACANSYQCVNTHVCNTTCVPAYSLDVGIEITNVDLAFVNFACASGFTNSGKCALRKYAAGSTVDKGLVKCNLDDNCNYDVILSKDGATKTTATSKCACGYNKEGQGHCEYSLHDADTQVVYDKSIQIKKSNLENTMHSRHRFSGQKADAKVSAACLPWFINSRYANAVECTKATLGFGKCTDNIDPSDTTTSTGTETATGTSSSTNSTLLKVSSFLIILVALIFA